MSKPYAPHKVGGDLSFKGQPARREGAAAPSEPDARINKQNQSNKFNGSGGSKRVISPGSVKGSNP